MEERLAARSAFARFTRLAGGGHVSGHMSHQIRVAERGDVAGVDRVAVAQYHDPRSDATRFLEAMRDVENRHAAMAAILDDLHDLVGVRFRERRRDRKSV